MNMITTVQRFFTGYDFFISYSRFDCSEYASNLANKIIEEKYSCYLDQWGSSAGRELPKSLKRKLKNSSILILLGSDASLVSKAIEEEIEIFTQTKKIIIPVALSDITEATWFTNVEGIAISNEIDNFKNNSISTILVTRLKNSLNYTRQSVRIRNSIFLFIFLMIISVGSLFYLFSQRKKMEKVNSSLTSSIRFKVDSLKELSKNIITSEGKLKLTQGSLEKTKSKNDALNKDIISKEGELKLTALELNANQKKLLIANTGLNESTGKVKDFTYRTLNSYEPPERVDCKCIKKDHIILFDTDSDRVKPNYQIYLSKILNCSLINGDYIELVGYDLENNSDAYSLNLAERRAQSVARYLIDNGYMNDRIKAWGKKVNDNDKKLLDLVGVSRVELTVK